MNKKALKKYKFIRVDWADAQSDCEWGSIDKIKEWADKDCIIHDVGWLVYEGDRYIVISSQFGEDGEFGNRTKIPKQWIVKRSDIKPKKRENK